MGIFQIIDENGQLNESVLNAYIDGELDGDLLQAVEQAVAENPQLQHYVEDRRQLNSLFTKAYNPIMETAPGAGLQEWMESIERLQSTPQPAAVVISWRSLAAGVLVLAMGFGGGFFIGESRLESRLVALEQARASALHEIAETKNSMLEYTPSGEAVTWSDARTGDRAQLMPVRTMQTKDKRFCREFREVRIIGGETEEVHGISCRTGKEQWQTEMLFKPEKKNIF